MKYRFGEFTLDSHTRRLLRDEKEIHLSPKAFDLLTALIENRARVMSKGDLQHTLWPSTYVQETNLASLVAEIRRAIDDSADEPRVIRTVHRIGYWFIGELSEERESGEDVPPLHVRYWLMCGTRQIPLDPGDHVLGRAPDTSVFIDAPGVSRHHARIRVDGTTATVEDLGSKNGTYLQGERIIAPSPLNDGDQIRLGSVLMAFRIPPPADATDTAPG